MKKIIFFLIITCFICNITFAQYEKSDFLKTGLIVLDIKTVYATEPTCDFVQAPEESMGTSCTNVTKVLGQLILLQQNGDVIDTLFNTGEYNKDNSGITLKVRGNTSAYSYKSIRKFPFKIKLEKKADLLLRGDDKYADKDWVLINTANKFGNDAGRKLSELMSFEYTPAFEYVNVFINDSYRGTYLLSENVKRSNNRINIDKKTGYIIEHDPYWWNEDVSFGETFVPLYKYTFKYPDTEDVTSDQISYISEAVANMEQHIQDGTYEDYIDTESFAKWLLAEDILGSWDGGGVNLFFAKTDNTINSKFTIPCLWDYDSSFEVEQDKWSNLRPRFLFQTLLDSNNRTFAKTYKEIWENNGREYCQSILDYINNLSSSDRFKAISKSFKMEEAWYASQSLDYLAGDFNKWVNYAKVWFTNRPIWMDEQISLITTKPIVTNNIYYDVCGRRISTPSHGLYIHNGMKYAK